MTTEADPPAASEQTAPAVPETTRRRLTPLARPRDGWSWLVAGVITAIAAIIRLVELDRPARIVFDEVYYAPEGWSLFEHGVAWEITEGGASPVNGSPVLGDSPAYVVHPPLGKWMIGLGEVLFGYTPFGWRIAAAVAGVLSVLMVVRIGRRLFGSTTLGAAAGLLVAVDGMHVVTSRTALLDIFLLFFLVAAFGALLLDRDSRRSRWLAALTAGRVRPPFAVPWWRLAAAGLLGCAVAVKWSAAFFIPVFLVLVLWWEAGARRSAGVARPWRATFIREWPSLALSAVLVPLVYLASWGGWFATDHGYLRHYPEDVRGESGLTWLVGSMRNLIDYHRHALDFHSGLDASHIYQSEPWQWLLLARPVLYHSQDMAGCGADRCISMIYLLGTPALWWSFLLVVPVVVWLGIARRDWRVPAVLLPAAAGIVPWLFFPDRVMFYFYALPSQPFLVLAVVYLLGVLVTPGREGATVFGLDRRTVGIALAGGYVALVVVTFAYFYPLYTAEVISHDGWHARMWLDSWAG